MQPKLTLRGLLFKTDAVPKWSVWFPGVDRSVVMRSQRHFYETKSKRPIQMMSYLEQPSGLVGFVLLLGMGILAVLCFFKLGIKLLEKVFRFLSIMK